MEFQQTDRYADYIRRLRWTVISVDHTYIYIKRLPLLGGLAKIQRPERLPALSGLIPELKKYGVRTVAAEPKLDENGTAFDTWLAGLGRHFRLNKTPFMSSKTILIDLTPTEGEIFSRFSEAKRRAVRRAAKNGIAVTESTDINAFTRLKAKSAGMFGGITTFGFRELWEATRQDAATILTAHVSTNPSELVAGVLLIVWKTQAYYWIAGATKKGKQLFAPTILVWEALKLARAKGAASFDFLGVWDERYPAQNSSWKGFSKFKEGFGGKPAYYPVTATPHR